MPVYAVDKSLGPTSHDVVAAARRVLGTRRVGHAGTLDPLASGLLLVLAGEATKLSPFLSGADKGYLAWVAFGASTPTLDAEGPVTERGEAGALDAAQVRSAAAAFLDVHQQVPPAFSAVKEGGEAAYRKARRGEAGGLPPRPAGYHEVDLLAFGPRASLPPCFGPAPEGWRPLEDGRPLPLPPPLSALPTAVFRVEVRAGTYLRAFARDLGRAVGVPAHLAGLVRTRVGAVDLASAVPVEALAEAAGVPEAEALPYPTLPLSAEQVARVRQGQRLPRAALPGHGTVGLTDPDGRLVAVCDLEPERMRLRRVWPA
ncbi:MAG: tRNA pseudouridine(55) synthase TruB [Trueperaceae bacterium]|nr:tRNA pseudouridine(55) synthase TruB [Trueperaceae bacterium]